MTTEGLTKIRVEFEGPYRLTRPADNLVFEAPLAERSGVYLWAGPSTADVAWIFYVGETSKSFNRRFFQHLERQMSGSYAAYDMEALGDGILKALWDGYGWKRRGWDSALTHLESLDERGAALRHYLALTEVFLAPLIGPPELGKRVESALLRHLRHEGDPVQQMVKGNRSTYYPEGDRKYIVEFRCARRLHGFPSTPLEA